MYLKIVNFFHVRMAIRYGALVLMSMLVVSLVLAVSTSTERHNVAAAQRLSQRE